MLKKVKPKLPITKADQKKSYYKYYLEDIHDAPSEKYEKILAGPLPVEKMLPIEERNRLFEPGYLEDEIGWGVFPNGVGYVANMTKMSGVTAEMLDWWFAWHCLDDFRYTIWNPEEHRRATSQQKKRAMDPSLTMKEKLWDTSHYVVEDIGMGLSDMCINFMYPGDLGYDMSKIGTEYCATLICARGNGLGGNPPFACPEMVMTHMAREIDGGIELRSRFWLGYSCFDKKIVKTIPDWVRFPDMGPLGLCLHNAREFTNLAYILPRIYEEEKDNFTCEM